MCADKSVMFGHQLTLSCDDVDGYPEPTISWTFNGVVFNQTNSTAIEVHEFAEENEGIYECTANNDVGQSISREFSVLGVAGGN